MPCDFLDPFPGPTGLHLRGCSIDGELLPKDVGKRFAQQFVKIIHADGQVLSRLHFIHPLGELVSEVQVCDIRAKENLTP